MNKYDNAELDIKKLLADQKLKLPPKNTNYRSAENLTWLRLIESKLDLYSTGLLMKLGIRDRLIHANLILNWFEEFHQYWKRELQLRRLDPADFHFLRNIYRQKFQALAVPSNASDQENLRQWQLPENIYLIFRYQYKLALNPLSAHRFASYIPKNADICEYGCGLAPLTYSLQKYYREKNFNITAIDIPSYMLHFVRWRHRNNAHIEVPEIPGGNHTPLTKQYDFIACLTVFEHLPEPLITAQHIHQHLKPGGIFVFDYINTNGDGLDTEAAATQRQDVLRFIQKNFEIVNGNFSISNESLKTIVARK